MIDEKEKLELEIEKLKLENENLKLSKNIKQNVKTETSEERNRRIAEAEKKLKADIENIKSDSYVPKTKNQETKPPTSENIKDDNTVFYIFGVPLIIIILIFIIISFQY